MMHSLFPQRYMLYLFTFVIFAFNAEAAPFFSSPNSNLNSIASPWIPSSQSSSRNAKTNSNPPFPHRKRQFATFGPHLSLGQTESEYIKLTTTFIPGRPPATATGSLFIWPGFFDQKNRSEGDLVQTVAEFHNSSTMKDTCGAGPGQWCIRPFVVSKSYISQTPERGRAIDGGDAIRLEYVKAPGEGGSWNQSIWNGSKGGERLFSYVKGSARCKWFEIATESQGGNKGSADTQFYYNTTLVLKDPDPKLGERFITTGDIKATKPVTTDGGRNWFIEKVEVPPMLPGTAWKPG
ncbi:hypothetical protein EJ08DRAFT_268380 [Tothia fuscella]|uniref:Uncharacterized protein n=1 Tax=Tothia fuscella TaxID=1048955 RepID=A0A9P4NR51_9PEZI|nr:hypothetical protein EJ08DRAFT_268380 [Tothia fuscella]